MLDTSVFKLRPMREQDMQTVRRWRNQPHVKAFMFTDKDISESEHSSWFQTTLQREDADYQIVEYNNEAIGLANAVQIELDAGSCHWGFYLGEQQSPKGSGSVLAKLMLQHIFDTYAVNTIYGEVFSFNTASLKLHEKFGFKPVEDITKTVDKNGKQENVITLSLSRERWLDVQNTLHQAQP